MNTNRSIDANGSVALSCCQLNTRLSSNLKTMKTDTKQTENTAECGNKSKPLLANRYFLVFYIGNLPNGKVTGYIDFTTDGCYLNKSKTIEQIKEVSKNLTEIVITNIIEMSESDSKDWHS